MASVAFEIYFTTVVTVDIAPKINCYGKYVYMIKFLTMTNKSVLGLYLG